MKALYKEISIEELKTMCKNSSGMLELMRNLGYSNNRGNSYAGLKKYLNENNIDISHFRKHGGGVKPISDEDLFVEHCTYTNMTKLKQRILKKNLIEYKCSICGISEWNGKQLTLQLDHINGNNKDNRLSNLRLLCPNCHSQTDTFCKRKPNIDCNPK